MYRLHVTNTDTFQDVGEGKRKNGDIWYRQDLNQIRAFLNGQIVILFNNAGKPGKVPQSDTDFVE